MTDKNTLKSWFKNLLKPTQEQFWEWMDSYFHKSEKIPLENIEGLNNQLAGLATRESVNEKVDKVEGKGLSANDFSDDLKEKLGGVEENAQANVQSDWNENDTTNDAYIKNKPTIPEPVDISGKLDTGGYEGTARELKEEIGNLEKYLLKTSINISTSDLIERLSQNGRVVATQGTSNIVVTIDSGDGFVASYQKLGTGDVTFQAGNGKTLVQVGSTNVIDGEVGSTATVTVFGSTAYLRISNV